MRCVECGQELRAGARFCDGCGEAVAGRRGARKEICKIERLTEQEGCLSGMLGGLLGRATYRNYLEATVAGSVIARTEVFTYLSTDTGWGGDDPIEAGRNEAAVRQRLIDALAEDGWEPIVDPKTGDVNVLQRVVE